jgi:hypothetical protein
LKCLPHSLQKKDFLWCINLKTACNVILVSLKILGELNYTRSCDTWALNTLCQDVSSGNTSDLCFKAFGTNIGWDIACHVRSFH